MVAITKEKLQEDYDMEVEYKPCKKFTAIIDPKISMEKDNDRICE